MDKQTARNNGLKARSGIPEPVRRDYNVRLLQKMQNWLAAMFR